MVTVQYPPTPEIEMDSWFLEFKRNWRQGEHVSIIGGTGTGKTTVAHQILDCRTFVCVLAVKRRDDTLDRFRNGHKYGRSHYTIIKKWPPDYPARKIVLWVKPESITDAKQQAEKLHAALNEMYLQGGWCIYFDEAGLIAGYLGLAKALGVLLNQGRSAGISVVATMTRPTSMVAQVPKETLNQPRHKLIFKYENEDEIKACAAIANINWKHMAFMQEQLAFHGNKRFSDFLSISQGTIKIVRNTGEQ